MDIEILGQLDSEATQEEVEKALRQYRTFMLTVPEERMPNLTAQYTLEMPNFSNIKQSAVENASLENVNNEVERSKFIGRISYGLRKLTLVERKIIGLKYLDLDPWYSTEIAEHLHIGKTKYYQLRNRAFYKMALAMGIEKYKEEVTSHEVR